MAKFNKIFLIAYSFFIGIITIYIIFNIFFVDPYPADLDKLQVNPDTNADFMVIIKEDAINPQKCILINDTKEIGNYLNSYKWHDKHLVCCFDAGHSDYTINAVKNDYISEQIYFDNKWEVGPYNSDFFNKTKIYIEDFDEKSSFLRYLVSVPISVDYDFIKDILINDENFYVYFQKDSMWKRDYEYVGSERYSFSIVSDYALSEDEILNLTLKYNIEINVTKK